MKRIQFALLFLGMICFSCNNCKDDISEFNKEGYSFANGTPKDFEGYAVFRYGQNFDPEDGWEDDSSSILLVLNSIDDCITTAIDVLDLPLSKGDTTFLHSEDSNNLPRAELYELHGDQLLNSYDLTKNNESWVLVDVVNSDGTEIKGQFNLSFYYPGDSEGRQDSIFYSNGEFTAEFGIF